MSLPWPLTRYIAARKHGLVFCPIPKIATNSFKKWMLMVDGRSFEVPSVTSQQKLQLRRHVDVDPYKLLDESFKFAFVRNPYARLVSAYLNKLVDKFPPGIKCYTSMCDFAGVEPWRGVTFHEFLRYIHLQRPEEMDPHWMPQHLFLSDIKWDFIGRFEELPEAMDDLVKRTGVPFPTHRMNRTPRSLVLNPSEMIVADARAWHLRGFKACTGGYPATVGAFYTKTMKAMVREMFREDFERFGYEK